MGSSGHLGKHQLLSRELLSSMGSSRSSKAAVAVGCAVSLAIIFATPLSDCPAQGPVRVSDHEDRAAQAVLTDVIAGNFYLSLDTREEADFLLTPALLVQEALSPDSVLTYPTE